MQDDSEPDDSYGKVVPSPAQEPDDSNEEAETGPLEKQDDSHEEVEIAAHEQDDSDGEAEVGEEVGVGPAQKPKKKRRGVWIAVAVVVVLIVAGGVYALYEANQSDDEIAEPTPTTPAGGVEIPQVPSLKMVEEEGTLYVENDGNVTMSDIEVRDAAGTTVCAMEVISPGDREPCEEAGDAQDLTVFGSGPQGQPVEAGLSEESPDS
jgi:hypothetical protein